MVEIDNVFFELRLVLSLRSVDQFLQQLCTAVQGRAWPPVLGFASPGPTKPIYKPSPERDLDVLLTLVPRIAKLPSDVTVSFGKLSSLAWGQRPDGATFFLSLTLSPNAKVFDDPAECVRAPTHVARKLLEGADVKTAAIDRFGDPEACVPFVPLGKTRRPLVVTTDAEVEAEYARPEDFWSAGWNVERFGDLRLLTRCQNVVDKGGVLREIQEHQWQMARAARPSRTKYGTPSVAPDERPIYEAGEPRIFPVGRHRESGLVEYSCVLNQGAHLHGYEIYYLRSLALNKKMQDGTPLSAVRVVFLEPWMAESEKRPLLDNGVQVFYEDATTGNLVQVTE